MQQTGINIELDLNDLEHEACSGSWIKFQSADRRYLLMAGHPAINYENPVVQTDASSAVQNRHGEDRIQQVFTSEAAALSTIKPVTINSGSSGINENNSRHEIKLNFKNPEAISGADEATELALQIIRGRLAEAEAAEALLFEPLIPAGRFFLDTQFFEGLWHLALQAGLKLIADERRTGLGLTGQIWAFEHFGLEPDAVLFGNDSTGVHYLAKKKTTIKIAELSKQLIADSWLLDDNQLKTVTATGEYLLEKLLGLEREFPAYVTCVRGLGLFTAFNLPSGIERDEVLRHAAENGLILEYDGERSIMIRPAPAVSKVEVDKAIELLDRAILDTLK